MIIFNTVEFIRKELNTYLKKDRREQDPVVLSSLLTQDGNVPSDANQKVVLSLINIERENTASSATFYARSTDGNSSKMSPALHLNLYLLVTGGRRDNERHVVDLDPRQHAVAAHTQCVMYH